MNELVCDRIEGDLVILIDENGTVSRLPLSRFPRRPCEGDVFDESLVFQPERTEIRKTRIAARFHRLTKQKGE